MALRRKQMQANKYALPQLLIPVVVMVAILTSAGACGSGEPTAMTCAPGMKPAGNQNICIYGTCGNGVIDTDEECDDGNQVAGDGCSSDCRSAEVCGNALVDYAVGEVCDDGNTDPDDQCCSDCRSCPDRAVVLLDEAPEPVIERTPPAAFPCTAVTAVQVAQSPRSLQRLLRSPVDVGSLLVDLFLRQAEPTGITTPVPLEFVPVQAPLAFEPVLFPAEMPAADLPVWITDELARVRATADELQQRLRSKSRAHRRLKRAEELFSQELQVSQDTIEELKQINGELHQYLNDDCQQLPRGRSNGLQ